MGLRRIWRDTQTAYKEEGVLHLSGLSGTNGKPIECEMVNTSAGVLRALKARRAVTAAGDNGAINIWKDDEGNYRCAAMRFYQTLDEKVFSNKELVFSWWKEWFKEIK